MYIQINVNTMIIKLAINNVSLKQIPLLFFELISAEELPLTSMATLSF